MLGMTPEARVAIETARLTHAVPAQENTKREVLKQAGETRRHGITEGKYYIVLIALLMISALQLFWYGKVDWFPLVLAVIVLGGPVGANLLKEFLQKYGAYRKNQNERSGFLE